MVVRPLLLTAAASATLLGAGACAARPVPIDAAASPAPLSTAWYTGAAPTPSVAPAQVAPGAYHPIPTSTGLFLAASPAANSASPAATTPAPGTATCTPTLGPATSIPVTATAGTGTLTAHWTDLSDPAVLTYRLAAIPGNGAPTSWLTIAATHTCKTLTTTITGLAKNTTYEIWLDAVHTDTAYGMSGVTQETMIGRSPAVTVR